MSLTNLTRRKLLALVFAMALGSLTGLPRLATGCVKVLAVTQLPDSVVGLAMGWDTDKVPYYQLYYKDGFVRAQQGGFGGKCLPPTNGRAFEPAVQAWIAGFQAGRDAGGKHPPPAPFGDLMKAMQQDKN